MITDAILQKFKRALACAGVLFCNQIESAVRVLFYNQCVAVFCCVDSGYVFWTSVLLYDKLLGKLVIDNSVKKGRCADGK